MPRVILQREGPVDSCEGLTVKRAYGRRAFALRTFDEKKKQETLVEFSAGGMEPPKIGLYARLRITVEVIKE